MKKTPHCIQDSCWLKMKTSVGNENKSQDALKINVMTIFAVKEKVSILSYFPLRSREERGMKKILFCLCIFVYVCIFFFIEQ